MANFVTYQFAILSALAVLVLCLLVVSLRRRAQFNATPVAVPLARVVVEKSQQAQIKPVQRTATPKPAEPLNHEVKAAKPPATTVAAAPSPPVVVAPVFASPEDKRQRMLDDISANIRKSLIKPVPTYSPIQNSETPRESEYVRVKKQIITPHGQIRFSILKDSLAINMLAVLRRASLDWKSPDDLIGFVPPYLQAEAEILNDQVLLVGTPGHPERLAIPIRDIDADSSLRDCFEFVTNSRTAINTPAIVMVSENEFEIVSRGVITQPIFMDADRVHAEVIVMERNASDVRLLVESSSV